MSSFIEPFVKALPTTLSDRLSLHGNPLLSVAKGRMLTKLNHRKKKVTKRNESSMKGTKQKKWKKVSKRMKHTTRKA